VNSSEYNKKMDALIADLLGMIEQSGISASDAESVPAWLKISIEENNKNALRTSPFKVVPMPQRY